MTEVERVRELLEKARGAFVTRATEPGCGVVEADNFIRQALIALPSEWQSMTEFTDKQIETLRQIVIDWINEGFTSPPYSPEQLEIFRTLGITNKDSFMYDVERPS